MNDNFVFPTKQDLTDEWNWGWFGNDASQLNIYVQGKLITPTEFKEITGQTYNA